MKPLRMDEIRYYNQNYIADKLVEITLYSFCTIGAIFVLFAFINNSTSPTQFILFVQNSTENIIQIIGDLIENLSQKFGIGIS